MIKKMKIPQERIPILIGKNGKTKKEIEKMTKVKININDDITVEGEPLSLLDAENIITAIGRGFSPEKSLELIGEDKTLIVITLQYNINALKRIRSRIIGTKGKCRRNIERLTNTKISVYGRTISIIGKYDDVEHARGAIEKLIRGSSHKFVYSLLESAKSDECQENCRGVCKEAEGDKHI